MSQEQPRPKRSAAEIRTSLEATRRQIEGDLTVLGKRFERSTSLREQVERHPLLFAVAGVVVGFVVVRRPAVLLKAVRRLAGLGAPLIVSALLRAPSSRKSPEHVDEATGSEGA